MTTAPPTHSVQPVPGQVINATLRSKLASIDRELTEQDRRCGLLSADLDVAKMRLAELKAARAEIVQFLGEESAS